MTARATVKLKPGKEDLAKRIIALMVESTGEMSGLESAEDIAATVRGVAETKADAEIVTSILQGADCAIVEPHEINVDDSGRVNLKSEGLDETVIHGFMAWLIRDAADQDVISVWEGHENQSGARIHLVAREGITVYDLDLMRQAHLAGRERIGSKIESPEIVADLLIASAAEEADEAEALRRVIRTISQACSPAVRAGMIEAVCGDMQPEHQPGMKM